MDSGNEVLLHVSELAPSSLEAAKISCRNIPISRKVRPHRAW